MAKSKTYAEIPKIHWEYFTFQNLVEQINDPLLIKSMVLWATYLNKNGSNIKIKKEHQKYLETTSRCRMAQPSKTT